MTDYLKILFDNGNITRKQYKKYKKNNSVESNTILSQQIANLNNKINNLALLIDTNSIGTHGIRGDIGPILPVIPLSPVSPLSPLSPLSPINPIGPISPLIP